jgi:hypothetical protein
MTRAMGIVIGLLLAVGMAGAGDVSVQGGIGVRGQHELTPLYYLGGTISHFEIVNGMLWPEAAIGAWYSEHEYMIVDDSALPATNYNYDGFFGWRRA